MDCSPPGSFVHGNSLGKNTGVGCHARPQGIFLTQASNKSLLRLQHWQAGSGATWKPKIMSLLFSHWVVSYSLTHGLQHTSLPCPSPSPGAGSNSCPLSQWCHPTILCSLVPFSPRLQSFLASGSFLMSQLFESSGPSIGSFSFSISPPNEYSKLSGLISLQSSGLSRVFSNATVQKHQFFGVQLSLRSSCHIHTWLLAKPWLWLDGPLLAK